PLHRHHPGVRVVQQSRQQTGGFSLDIGQPGVEKVMILQRPILRDPQDVPLVRQLLQHGFVVVVEMDDYPLRTPDPSIMFAYPACHAVQTSTEPLAAFFREYNPNVAVFTNHLASLPPPREPNAPEAPVRVFFGALNREEDWAPLMPAINRVLREFGDKVEVEVVHDKQFFDALQTPMRRFTPFCHSDQYFNLLRGCELALLPLRPTLFNSMK